MRPFLAAAVVLLLAACGGGADRRQEVSAPVEKADITSEALQWADSLLASMSVERKAAQLFLPALYASGDEWTLRRVREYAGMGVGGVVLLKGDCSGAASISDSLSLLSEVPAFVAIDAEWGLAMRLADAPRFPSNGSISQAAGDQLMYDYGRELARECRRLGINMVLGPVVDLDSGGGVIGRRSFGGDPVRVADLAVAYARGLEGGGVMSVAKHFPGHGSVSVDSHRRKGVIARSLHEMDSLDLYPFRRWVEEGLSGIMVGHLAVPSIDSRMLPAVVSPAVIGELLRRDLGFRGLVITDALNMGGAEGYGADKAVMAGADMIVAPVGTAEAVGSVVAAVREGRLPERELTDRVRRILFYKYLFMERRPVTDISQGIVSGRADTIALRLTGREPDAE